jgi:hypothetical protein
VKKKRVRKIHKNPYIGYWTICINLIPNHDGEGQFALTNTETNGAWGVAGSLFEYHA